jgi:membrane protease subunit HflC
MNRIGLIVAGVLSALMLLTSTLFIVDQRQLAVVYALGEIKEVIAEPGLKFKLPPPFQNVVFLDKRVQTLDSPETRPIFTAEKKSLVIDWLVKWRIAEPRQFIRNNGTDIRNVESRLSPVVQAAFNEEITRRTVRGVLAAERDKVMQDVRNRLVDEAKAFGIEIVDVRIKRVDFVADITDSVYRRMESERKQVANELRSQGAAEGEKIRADADKQREVIIAEAYRDAQKLRCQGLCAVRRRFWSRSAVCTVLPQPGGLPRQFSQQERRDGGRSFKRFLQGHAGCRACRTGASGQALNPGETRWPIGLLARWR